MNPDSNLSLFSAVADGGRPNPPAPEPLDSGWVGKCHLSVEMGLYMAILALAALVRLYRLGLAPLSADEAAQAMAALRGTAPPPGASPLLYAINSLVFALMGAGDGLARLGAALFGLALVGWPYLWRHRLGRVGALGTAFVLAISPTAIVASRTLGGEIITALVGLGLLTAGDHYLRTRNPQWLYALAALAAMGLMGGSGLYTLAMVLASGLAFWKFSVRYPLPGAIPWKRLAVIVAALVGGGSTVLLWRPAGLVAVGDLLVAWLSGFRLEAGVTWWYLPFQILVFYEMLALLTGLAGLVIAVSRDDWPGVLLGYWALMVLLITTLRQGRTPQDMVLVVTPLAGLAGYALERLAGSLSRWRVGYLESVFIVILLVVMAYGGLALADYAANPGWVQMVGGSESPWVVHRAAVQGLLAMALLGIVLLLMASVLETEIALRGGALAVLVVLVLGTWATGWKATQVHPGDPRDLLAGPQPTSLSLRAMVVTLKTASEQQTGDPYALPLVVVEPAPAGREILAWTLRDFRSVQFASALDASRAPYIVITPLEMTPALASSYAGQDFAVTTTWNWAGRTGSELVRWLLYRQSSDAPLPESRVVVWVRQETEN